MWEKRYREELLNKRKEAYAGGGDARIARQHAQGKLTARERIEILFDKGTFTEVNTLLQSHERDICLPTRHIPGDGVVTGYGEIDGRCVCVAVEDFTVHGGTLGEYHSRKIIDIMDMALEMRVPFIMVNDSGGARIEEGVCSLNGYSGIFLRNTRASGIIPQIAVIMGPCAGGACYSPAICDFIFMVERTSYMFVTGPKVIDSVTGTKVGTEELGGAKVHSEISGVAHFTYPDDASCLQGVRKLLEYLPDHNGRKRAEEETVRRSCPSNRSVGRFLEECVPDNKKLPYDIRKVISCLADQGSVLEIQKDFAGNIVIAFAKMDGKVCGIVANQPAVLAGSLDADSSDKAARFVRFCDCFGIPLIVLADVPGFWPSVEQEHKGIIRHGAKLLYAFSEADVPKITLILRKAYGGAYIAMNSKGMGADLVYAWPIAELAVMGEEGAVSIVYAKRLAQAEDPAGEKEKLVQEYRDKFISPYISASNGFIDEIILPEETREKLCSALKALEKKHRKRRDRYHGNIPL